LSGQVGYHRGVTGREGDRVVAPELQVRELAEDMPPTAEQPAPPAPWKQLELF